MEDPFQLIGQKVKADVQAAAPDERALRGYGECSYSIHESSRYFAPQRGVVSYIGITARPRMPSAVPTGGVGRQSAPAPILHCPRVRGPTKECLS